MKGSMSHCNYNHQPTELWNTDFYMSSVQNPQYMKASTMHYNHPLSSANRALAATAQMERS